MRHPRPDRPLGPCRYCVRFLGVVLDCECLSHLGDGTFQNLLASNDKTHAAACQQADAKPVRLIIILLAVLHAGVALCFKILFFSYYVVKEVGPQDPLP